ncbi:hypothetical protein D3C87_2111410 [compost metagenome]
MGKQPRDRQIMGDDDNGEAEIVDETTHEIEQACLHRHIEATGRLVHEDESW